MDDEHISYEMLQDLVRAERRSNRLSPVQSRFWARLRDFLDDLKSGFREQQERDPFSRRAMMVRDEVQHALQAADTLWNLRERKMALYALAQPKEGNFERPEGLTAEEIDLYDRFVQTLREGKIQVVGLVAPPPAAKAPAPAPTPERSPAPETQVEVPAAPAPKPAAEQVPPDVARPAPVPPAPRPTPTVPADTPEDDMVTIRALGDIPPFVGPDMETYLLREGDFAMVPPAIARLLEKRGKAEVVESAA